MENEWIQDPLWKRLNVVKRRKPSKWTWTTAGGVKAANLLLDDLEKYLLEDAKS